MQYLLSFMLALGAFAQDIPLSPTFYWRRRLACPRCVFSQCMRAYQRGFAGSNVIVDLFIDLACSSCRNEWGTLNSVYESYADSVYFQYHVIPLPYHTWAFLASKSATVVDVYGDKGSVFDFFDTCFKRQVQLTGSASYTKTYDEMEAMVSTWATDGTGVTTDEYAVGMADSDNEMNTRYMWKYSTMHGVFGTPTFWVNGVEMSLTTYDQWSTTLDSLLA